MFAEESNIIKPIIKSEPINIPIRIKSEPINIPININSNRINDKNSDIILDTKNNILEDDNNYKLDFNQFDPSKFSPPNAWALRLKTRLKQYNNINNDICFSYLFDNK